MLFIVAEEEIEDKRGDKEEAKSELSKEMNDGSDDGVEQSQTMKYQFMLDSLDSSTKPPQLSFEKSNENQPDPRLKRAITIDNIESK